MNADGRLAIHGGIPASEGLPGFPVWPSATDDDERAVLEVLRSAEWGSNQGTRVAAFEREFAEAHGAAHAVAMVNGTMSLVVSLRAAGVGPGDEVIVPSYTFIATASAALFVGAIPIFADVRIDDHNIDPASVEALITERTKAIIVVHLAGNIADLDSLTAVAGKHGLALIEDAAQAVGASWRDRPVGAIGDLGSFSFQSSKNMTAGEGGIVVTDDDRLASMVYSLVNVGRIKGGGWYEHATIGYNLRMTEFQGAILRNQLVRLPQSLADHEFGAQVLRAELEGIEGIVVDRESENVTVHGRHLFMLRTPELARRGLRDAAVKALVAEGVDVSGGYVPLHRNEALLRERAVIAQRHGRTLSEPHCPVTDVVCTDTMWMPHHVLLSSERRLSGVAAAFRKVFAHVDQLEELVKV